MACICRDSWTRSDNVPCFERCLLRFNRVSTEIQHLHNNQVWFTMNVIMQSLPYLRCGFVRKRRCALIYCPSRYFLKTDFYWHFTGKVTSHPSISSCVCWFQWDDLIKRRRRRCAAEPLHISPLCLSPAQLGAFSVTNKRRWVGFNSALMKTNVCSVYWLCTEKVVSIAIKSSTFQFRSRKPFCEANFN